MEGTARDLYIALLEIKGNLSMAIQHYGHTSAYCYGGTCHLCANYRRAAEAIAKAEENESQKTNKGACCLDCLKELSEWMREHTGPRDGTVEMLTRAVEAIKEAGGKVR